MKQISELQLRRAENLIWNSARSHNFPPDFKAFDGEGFADIYWNCIIGAVRYHYEYEKLEAVFLSFEQYEDSDIYEGLLWLGLENAIFEREATERPVLEKLRCDYAKRFVDEYSRKYIDDYHLYDYLALAHYRRVLGLSPDIKKYSLSLLDELEFSPQMSTEEIVERAAILFKKWFNIRCQERKAERKKLPKISFRKKGGKSKVRRFGIGFAHHPEHKYGGSNQFRKDNDHIRSKMTAEELRRFMTEKYGVSIFDKAKIAEIERALCKDNHEGCNLHFTKGEPVKGGIQNGFEALHKAKEEKLIQANKEFYEANIAKNRTCITKLSNLIRNSVLMYLHSSPTKANSGEINARLVWRGAKLNDEQIFVKNRPDGCEGLSVDILLDASTSQQGRLLNISSQARIIAESLDRCGIPCRVMSFCSMTGYTIMRIYRDYNETSCNNKIFEYVSNGCNRDGLAIRAAHYLINSSPYDYKLLIILSDVKPNDIKKIRGKGENQLVPYENQAGINDTAYEVRKARADNIAVVCVFTGEDADLASAKLVYDKDFARIRSVENLAETVGNLIQNQIKNL